MFAACKKGLLALGVAGLALGAAAPAWAASCQVIAATHSAASKAQAAIQAQQLADQSAAELRQKMGWRSYTMRARKVTPDPFWKAVRPVVPPEIILKPDIVTAKTHSTCWPGVVVPYVCTAGAVVCGH
jgi:hypothetical protein